MHWRCFLRIVDDFLKRKASRAIFVSVLHLCESRAAEIGRAGGGVAYALGQSRRTPPISWTTAPVVDAMVTITAGHKSHFIFNVCVWIQKFQSCDQCSLYRHSGLSFGF